MQTINFHITKLDSMKKYPKEIYFIGNKELLDKPMVSIVGTRKPNSYTKLITSEISKKLSNAGVVIVSGAAMGVDAIAHQNAIPNTIAVVANGLDIKYPAINKNLITQIETNSLVLSTYPKSSVARTYTFVERNELVVALGDVLIVTQADINSGSLRSVEFALKMGKKIYTLPHRIGESEGTNRLLNQGLATAIYNVDIFLKSLGYENITKDSSDEFLEFCKKHPGYDEVVSLYGTKVFEYELLGKIIVENGIVKLA